MQDEVFTRNPLIVALDVATREAAVGLAAQLQEHVGGFKIGLELFTSVGPAVVHEVGPEAVFLDLKFHDIPNTAAGAARAAARLGVMMCNVHCLGGAEMMQRAAEAVRDVHPPTRILGVTVLTSHDAAGLHGLGLSGSPREAVVRLAAMAREAGLDGVVCSPQEIEAVRGACGADFLIVTPGVRPEGSAVADQKRVLTPHQAMQGGDGWRGADWIVVGRPITAAPDPAAAARVIVAAAAMDD